MGGTLVILCEENESSGYLYKLHIEELTEFEETIFIDADSLIIRDFSFLWDSFRLNGSEVSVIGERRFSDHDSNFFKSGTLEKYNINYWPSFNGGVYYLKKSLGAEKVFKDAMHFLDTYLDDGMKLFNGEKGDEPVMALSMAVNGMNPVAISDVMYCTPGMTNLKIDIFKKICSFYKYQQCVSPCIFHWGTSKL